MVGGAQLRLHPHGEQPRHGVNASGIKVRRHAADRRRRQTRSTATSLFTCSTVRRRRPSCSASAARSTRARTPSITLHVQRAGDRTADQHGRRRPGQHHRREQRAQQHLRDGQHLGHGQRPATRHHHRQDRRPGSHRRRRPRPGQPAADPHLQDPGHEHQPPPAPTTSSSSTGHRAWRRRASSRPRSSSNGALGTGNGCAVSAPTGSLHDQVAQPGRHPEHHHQRDGHRPGRHRSSSTPRRPPANIRNTGVTATATERTTVKPGVDLTITKADVARPGVRLARVPASRAGDVCVGGLKYTFVVGNSGIQPATNVRRPRRAAAGDDLRQLHQRRGQRLRLRARRPATSSTCTNPQHRRRRRPSPSRSSSSPRRPRVPSRNTVDRRPGQRDLRVRRDEQHRHGDQRRSAPAST